MLKVCGKPVRSLGIAARKSQVQVSPETIHMIRTEPGGRVKPHFIPMFIRSFSLASSTYSHLLPPLDEHYFYPVSTAPTITFTKGIKRRKAVIL